MRTLCLFLVVCVPVVSQVIEQTRTIPAVTRRTQLVLTLPQAPTSGDQFTIQSNTDKIEVSLAGPDGHKMDKSDAAVEWGGVAVANANSETVVRYSLGVTFKAPGQAGRYVFEFDTRAARSPVNVMVLFVPKSDAWEGGMRSAGGLKKTGPVELNAKRSSKVFDFSMTRAQRAIVFDALAASPATKVSLKLPDGRVISTAQGKDAEVEWATLENAAEYDEVLSKMLLPGEGVHHVFTLEQPKPGRYNCAPKPRRRIRLR